MKKDEFCKYCIEAYRPVETLIKLIPADKLDWKPGDNFMTFGELICHLSAGIGLELKMLIDNNWPRHPEGPLPSCNCSEALAALEKDKSFLREVLSEVTEEEFAAREAATPWGASGTIEKMGFDFKEHFTNHKMQLFTYLKILGIPVNTQTLYVG